MRHIGFKDIPIEVKEVTSPHYEHRPESRQRHVIEQEPSMIDLMSNFYGFMKRFIDKGISTVSLETFNNRTLICESCEMYDKEARLGLGRCNQKDCGCTNIKRWFTFEKCPLGKWSEV